MGPDLSGHLGNRLENADPSAEEPEMTNELLRRRRAQNTVRVLTVATGIASVVGTAGTVWATTPHDVAAQPPSPAPAPTAAAPTAAAPAPVPRSLTAHKAPHKLVRKAVAPAKRTPVARTAVARKRVVRATRITRVAPKPVAARPAAPRPVAPRPVAVKPAAPKPAPKPVASSGGS
jgi:hypothetical protein